MVMTFKTVKEGVPSEIIVETKKEKNSKESVWNYIITYEDKSQMTLSEDDWKNFKWENEYFFVPYFDSYRTKEYEDSLREQLKKLDEACDAYDKELPLKFPQFSYNNIRESLKNAEEKKKLFIERGKLICELYPFCLPVNIYSGEPLPDYDYYFTERSDWGWRRIFDEVCDTILNDYKRWTEKERSQFHIYDVKEKFGMLRISTSYSSENINKAISIAEFKSELVCQNCGKTEKDKKGNYIYYKSKGYWIKYRCKDCAKKEDIEGKAINKIIKGIVKGSAYKKMKTKPEFEVMHWEHGYKRKETFILEEI
ncbi:MAG: hypothetical protein HUJ68_03475 [Clostridia bacterium]|nr:hypothetical protein [Clostridia bacterium]